MRTLIIVLVILTGCAKNKQAEIEYPKRLPITETIKEQTKLPNYVPPSSGKIVSVEEGDPAPFPGVLLDESRAQGAGELRIAYDALYGLSVANQKFGVVVVEIQEKQLYRADLIVEKKDEQLDKATNSWWARNKGPVGLAIGIVVGVAITVAAGRIWAAIEEEQK